MKEKFTSDYDVGTSAVSETYFKDLKHSDLNDFNGPTRVDKFFIAHMRSIESSRKIQCASVKRKNATFPKFIDPSVLKKSRKVCDGEKKHENINANDEDSSSFFDEEKNEHLLEEENGKGKNMTKKKIEEEKKLADVTMSKMADRKDGNIRKKKTANNPLSEINNVKKVRRGKYFTKCPDIQFIHNRPLRRKKN